MLPVTKTLILLFAVLLLLASTAAGWKWNSHGHKSAGWTWETANAQLSFVEG